VKAPLTGDDPKNWVKQNSPLGQQLMQPKCPPGVSQENLEPVSP
jgi:hypothetical protein